MAEGILTASIINSGGSSALTRAYQLSLTNNSNTKTTVTCTFTQSPSWIFIYFTSMSVFYNSSDMWKDAGIERAYMFASSTNIHKIVSGLPTNANYSSDRYYGSIYVTFANDTVTMYNNAANTWTGPLSVSAFVYGVFE